MGNATQIWVDGVLDGQIPGDDPGLLFGLTVFETLRTYQGVPFRLERHIERLMASAAAMDIALPSQSQIRREILDVCAGDVSIRYTVTAAQRTILQVRSLSGERPCQPKRVTPLEWVNPPSLPGAVKHGCRAAWLLAARKADVDEVLLVDASGDILEASRSNVFAVCDGRMMTPPLDGRQLAGVTREALFDAASSIGLAIEETAISVSADFDEFYLASTLKELSPVPALSRKGFNELGPLGKRLHDAFTALVIRECGGR
ncbi:MAG: aminotransferase class IV [Bradymonadia bacterium]